MKKIIIMVVLIFICGVLFADEDPIIYPSMRIKGMGGAFTAIADDHNAAFYNPAGYSITAGKSGDRAGWFSVLEINPFIDVASISTVQDVLDKSENSDGDIDAILNDAELFSKLLSLKSKLGIAGPLMFGYTGYGFSITAFDYINVNINSKQKAFLPYTDLHALGDAGIIIGKSFPIMDGIISKTDALYGGINLKFVVRGKIEKENISAAEALYIANSSEVIKNLDYLRLGYGFGSDIGFLWSIKGLASFSEFRVALTIRDWFGTVFHYKRYDDDFNAVGLEYTETLSPSINLGCAMFFPNILVFPRFIMENLKIGVDIINFASFKKQFFTKLYWGAETTVLKILRVRAGFGQGYVALGLGIHFLIIDINAAYWGEELGTQPGQIKQDSVGLSVAIRF